MGVSYRGTVDRIIISDSKTGSMEPSQHRASYINVSNHAVKDAGLTKSRSRRLVVGIETEDTLAPWDLARQETLCTPPPPKWVTLRGIPTGSSGEAVQSSVAASSVPQEFLCPLSLEPMTDPVIIASGQTFERAFIARWFEEGNVSCPKTRQALPHANFCPNFALKSMISDWCSTNGVDILASRPLALHPHHPHGVPTQSATAGSSPLLSDQKRISPESELKFFPESRCWDGGGVTEAHERGSAESNLNGSTRGGDQRTEAQLLRNVHHAQERTKTGRMEVEEDGWLQIRDNTKSTGHLVRDAEDESYDDGDDSEEAGDVIRAWEEKGVMNVLSLVDAGQARAVVEKKMVRGEEREASAFAYHSGQQQDKVTSACMGSSYQAMQTNIASAAGQNEDMTAEFSAGSSSATNSSYSSPSSTPGNGRLHLKSPPTPSSWSDPKPSPPARLCNSSTAANATVIRSGSLTQRMGSAHSTHLEQEVAENMTSHSDGSGGGWGRLTLEQHAMMASSSTGSMMAARSTTDISDRHISRQRSGALMPHHSESPLWGGRGGSPKEIIGRSSGGGSAGASPTSSRPSSRKMTRREWNHISAAGNIVNNGDTNLAAHTRYSSVTTPNSPLSSSAAIMMENHSLSSSSSPLQWTGPGRVSPLADAGGSWQERMSTRVGGRGSDVDGIDTRWSENGECHEHSNMKASSAAIDSSNAQLNERVALFDRQGGMTESGMPKCRGSHGQRGQPHPISLQQEERIEVSIDEQDDLQFGVGHTPKGGKCSGQSYSALVSQRSLAAAETTGAPVGSVTSRDASTKLSIPTKGISMASNSQFQGPLTSLQGPVYSTRAANSGSMTGPSPRISVSKVVVSEASPGIRTPQGWVGPWSPIPAVTPSAPSPNCTHDLYPSPPPLPPLEAEPDSSHPPFADSLTVASAAQGLPAAEIRNMKQNQAPAGSTSNTRASSSPSPPSSSLPLVNNKQTLFNSQNSTQLLESSRNGRSGPIAASSSARRHMNYGRPEGHAGSADEAPSPLRANRDQLVFGEGETGGGGRGDRPETVDMDELVDMLNFGADDERRQAVKNIRLAVKASPENRARFVAARGVESLVEVLEAEDREVVDHAMCCLLILSLHWTAASEVVRAGGIPAIVKVLQGGSPGSRAASAATIYALCKDENNKLMVRAAGAVPPLIELLQTGTLRGRKDASLALFTLSTNPRCARDIVRLGAIPVLLEMAVDSNPGMEEKAAAVLANLAQIPDACEAMVNEAEGLERLVDLLDEGATNRVKEDCAAILLMMIECGCVKAERLLQEGVLPSLVAVSQNCDEEHRDAEVLLNLLRQSTPSGKPAVKAKAPSSFPAIRAPAKRAPSSLQYGVPRR